MKVLIPVEDAGLNQQSAVGHLDNSEYVCIYDTEQDGTSCVPMKEISAKKGNLSVEMKRQGIDTMICTSIPSLAYDLFSLMGINVLQATEESVSKNIKAFKDKKLGKVTTSSDISMSGCASSSCASCSSAC